VGFLEEATFVHSTEGRSRRLLSYPLVGALVGRLFIGALLPIALFLAWWQTTTRGILDPTVIPKPSQVVSVISALSKKQIDGMVVWPPVIQQAISQNVAYEPKDVNILDNTELGGAPDGLLAVTTSFMKNTSAFTAFLESYVDALHYAESHPSQYASFVAKLTGTSLALAKASTGPSPIQGGFSLSVSKTGLLGAAKYGKEFAYTRKDVGSKVLDYIDLAPLASVLHVSASSLLTS
jgi:ABC-type nitrate/sulfonate/bicarbonate transport system substrate-binding protein